MGPSWTWAGALGASLAVASPALGDISITGFLSQRFDVSEDVVSEDEEPTAYGSQSSVGLVFSQQGEHTSWTAAPGLSFDWDSEDELETIERVNPRINASLRHVEPRVGFTATLSVIPQFTSVTSGQNGFTDLLDAGNAAVDPADPAANDPNVPAAPDPVDDGLDDIDDDPFEDGDLFDRRNVLRVTSRASLGASFRLDPLTSLSTSAFTRLQRYDTPSANFSDNDTFGLQASLGRRVTPDTRLSVNSGVTQFNDVDGDDESLTYRVGVGANTTFTPLISGGANLGVSLVQSDSSGESQDEIGFSGGVRASFAGRYTNASISASQRVDQTDSGELVNRSAITASIGHALTPLTQANFSSRLGFDNPVFGDGEDEQILSFAASLSHTLTRDWRVSIGYSLRFSQEEDQDLEVSNGAFLQLSRSLSLLP